MMSQKRFFHVDLTWKLKKTYAKISYLGSSSAGCRNSDPEGSSCSGEQTHPFACIRYLLNKIKTAIALAKFEFCSFVNANTFINVCIYLRLIALYLPKREKSNIREIIKSIRFDWLLYAIGFDRQISNIRLNDYKIVYW